MDECKISSHLNPNEEPCTREDSSTLEELEVFLGNGKGDQFVIGSELIDDWNFMGWVDYSSSCSSSSSLSSSSFFLKEEEEEEEEEEGVLKQESAVVSGFWEKNYRSSLNLSLNYQEVLDAWSDRGPLVVDIYGDGFSVPDVNQQSNVHAGEVPVMEKVWKEKDRRRALLLKYREKRHNRLCFKKIRYEVRRINAVKRPRLKGRFVKRNPQEEMLT